LKLLSGNKMALLIQEKISHATLLGIWKKEESLEFLQDIYPLNTNELTDFNKITNKGRQKEWLTTRILLTEILQQKLYIKHNINGKPLLENHNSNITISHSKNFVALIVSGSYFPGIDIEHVSNRVSRVKHKFLTTNELTWCNNLEQMTACWSAKEAIFKIYEKELDFQDVEISAFNIEEAGNMHLQVNKSGKESGFLIKYRQIEEDILTYVLSKSSI